MSSYLNRLLQPSSSFAMNQLRRFGDENAGHLDTDTHRIPTPEEYCHERLGSSFATALSTYDTTRRVEILIDQFLDDDMLRDREILDVGCGLGVFSQRLAERPIRHTDCIAGPHFECVGRVEPVGATSGVNGECLAARDERDESVEHLRETVNHDYAHG